MKPASEKKNTRNEETKKPLATPVAKKSGGTPVIIVPPVNEKPKLKSPHKLQQVDEKKSEDEKLRQKKVRPVVKEEPRAVSTPQPIKTTKPVVQMITPIEALPTKMSDPKALPKALKKTKAKKSK